mgnify:CR=1 FL=1
MNNNLRRVYSKKNIEQKIKEISYNIHQDYDITEDIVLICVLNGAFKFCNQLLKELTLLIKNNIYIDFVKVSSYGNEVKSTGEVNLLLDSTLDLNNKHVIIVEDIVDTGTTIRFLHKYFTQKNPKSIKVAALLYKNTSIDNNLVIDYKCFKIEDFFAVGYGLDYAQKYRNLEGIYNIENE